MSDCQCNRCQPVHPRGHGILNVRCHCQSVAHRAFRNFFGSQSSMGSGYTTASVTRSARLIVPRIAITTFLFFLLARTPSYLSKRFKSRRAPAIAATGLPVQQLLSLYNGKAPNSCRTHRRSSRLISFNISEEALWLHCTLHSYKDNQHHWLLSQTRQLLPAPHVNYCSCRRSVPARRCAS